MENGIDFRVLLFLFIIPLLEIISNVFQQTDCEGEDSSVTIFLLDLYST